MGSTVSDGDHWWLIEKSQDFIGLWDGSMRASTLNYTELDGWQYISQRGFENNETTTFRLNAGDQGGDSNIAFKIDGEVGCMGSGAAPNDQCRDGFGWGAFDEIRIIPTCTYCNRVIY